jgi:hypothetical protein
MIYLISMLAFNFCKVNLKVIEQAIKILNMSIFDLWGNLNDVVFKLGCANLPWNKADYPFLYVIIFEKLEYYTCKYIDVVIYLKEKMYFPLQILCDNEWKWIIILISPI